MKEVPPMPQPESEKETPKPEDIGFEAKKGSDYLSGDKNASSRIEQMSIDNIAERKGKFENLLKNIERVSGNREVITSISKMVEKLEAEETFGEKTRDVVDFLNFAKSAIANFNDKAALKLVFERGPKDILLESLIIGRGFYKLLEEQGLSGDITNAASSAAEIAAMLYAQEHDGHGYQTAEEKREFEEAKKRSADLKIS